MAKKNLFLDSIVGQPTPDSNVNMAQLAKDKDEEKELAKRRMKHIRHEMKMADEAEEKGDKEMAKKHKAKAHELAEEGEMGKNEKFAAYEADMAAQSDESKKLQKQLDVLTAKLEKYSESLNEVKLGISTGNDNLKKELIEAMNGSIKATIDSYVKGE